MTFGRSLRASSGRRTPRFAQRTRRESASEKGFSVVRPLPILIDPPARRNGRRASPSSEGGHVFSEGRADEADLQEASVSPDWPDPGGGSQQVPR